MISDARSDSSADDASSLRGTKRVVTLPGGTIECSLTGSGPVVCLVSTLSGTWVGQIRALREHFTVLRYDMRGFGRSTSLNGFPANEEHGDDLARVLEALEIPRATIVGLSHGGVVAQQLAIRHPERVAGLVLVSTFARARGSTRIFLNLLNGFLEQNKFDEFWQVLKCFLCSEANWSSVMGREQYLRKQMFDQYTVDSLRAIYGGALVHDATEKLADLRCPTLVIGGDEDMLFPPAITRALSQAIPNAGLELLPAAHVPPVEVPEAFNRVLLEFCSRVAVEGARA